MRKKVFPGVFALALLATAGSGVNRSMNSNANLSDLALQNVLALADVENPDPGEGGGGTSAKFCLIKQSFGGEQKWAIFCDARTDETTIYPCDKRETLGGYISSAQDRCTT